MSEKVFGKYTCLYCGHSWEAYEPVECKSCGNLSPERLAFTKLKEPEPQDRVDVWWKIGLKNCWIVGAYDPSWTRKSFSKCETVEELIEHFDHGNWCLGQAFYYKNICFINQVNAGDEWLVIRDDIPFESITARRMLDKIPEFIERIRRATPEQLRRLEY